MKRMGIAVCVVALMLRTGPAQALPEPVELWTLETGAPLGASPIGFPTGTTGEGDPAGSGPDSVLLGVGGQVLRISGTGEILWHAEFGPEAGRGGLFEACAADLDGDGVEEVIGGHKGGYVVALEGDTGAVRWEFNLGSGLDSWEMARAADLDGDGKAEVIASAQNGWIYCLNGDGSLRWRSRMEHFQPSTVSIGDINGDGRLEIVYGTATRHLIALRDDGTLLWDAFLPPHHLGRTAPLLADLDGDGRVEIYSLSSMVAPDTGVVSVNGADGSLRWTGPTWSKAYMSRSVIQFDDGTRGLLTADKGNFIAAFHADGAPRWQTQVNGRGIWTPGAVADLDGDGKHEVMFTVRDRSNDGKNTSWYVLNAEGEVLGAYAAGNGFGSPLVADINGDGVLEVVLNTRDGHVMAYTFGGPAREGAVVSTGWIQEDFLGNAKVVPPSPAPPKEIKLYGVGIESEAPLAFGRTEHLLALPDGMNAAYAELRFVSAHGTQEVERFAVGEQGARLYLPSRGTHGETWDLRWLDARGRKVGEQSLNRSSERRPGEMLEVAYTRAVQHLTVVQAALREQEKHEASAVLGMRVAQLQAEHDRLQSRIAALAGPFQPEQDFLAEDLAAFETKLRLDEIGAFAGLVNMASFPSASSPQGTRFILWEESNPWDNKLTPYGTQPLPPAPLELHAFGNEVESVCVNLMSLSASPLTLRIEPGIITAVRVEAKPQPAEAHATLMRVAWMPSRLEPAVADLLPKLDEGRLIDLAPGEIRQLWINVSTCDLEAGSHVLEWPIRTLDRHSETQVLRIDLEVSPVRLPEKSRFLINTWAKNEINGISTVEDLNDHLHTVWYQLPLPSMQADAEGNLVGEADWSKHDDILSRAKQVELILYGWPPTPSFPEGVEETDALRLKAQRQAAKRMVEHLATFGLGYEHFCFYVEDEPGLTGSIEHYLERARALKEIDPRLQTYANPWEAVWTERIEAMWPETDVWQPGMELIEYHGPEFVAAMKRGGKPVLAYTPPGDARVLKPLGFYRAQAWQAYHWGITGGGWWVYHGGEDFWITDPEREPGYGAVAFDGRAIVTSRRWEATRDGIEDFNALTLLGELAEAKQDAAAQQALREAVDYVAGATITGMPAGAGGNEVDYAVFQEHRRQIRETLERLSR